MPSSWCVDLGAAAFGKNQADGECGAMQAGEKRLQEEAGDLLGAKDRPRQNVYTQELLEEFAAYEPGCLDNDGFLLYLCVPGLSILPIDRSFTHIWGATPAGKRFSSSHCRRRLQTRSMPAHRTSRATRRTSICGSRRSKCSSTRFRRSRTIGQRGSRLQNASMGQRRYVLAGVVYRARGLSARLATALIRP